MAFLEILASANKAGFRSDSHILNLSFLISYKHNDYYDMYNTSVAIYTLHTTKPEPNVLNTLPVILSSTFSQLPIFMFNVFILVPLLITICIYKESLVNHP